MQKSITLDGNLLHQIAHRSTTATVVAKYLDSRDRIRHDSDIDRTRSQLIRNGESIVEADYLSFWKEMEDAGVGSIIYANKRNGTQKPTRFKFNYSLKAIGKAMLEGGDVKFAKPSPARSQAVESQNSAPTANPDEGFAQKTTFFLSPDRVAEIKIPDNFTLKEAEAIYTALKTLAE